MQEDIKEENTSAENTNTQNSQTANKTSYNVQPAALVQVPPAPQLTVSTDDVVTPPITAPLPEIPQLAATEVAVKPSSHRSKKLMWVALGLVLIAMLGFAAYHGIVSNNASSTKVTVVKKDIPLLRIAGLAPLPHDNYYPNIINDAMEYDVNMQLFEGLTKFTNGTTISPSLADSWTNPDSSTWVFKIHPNVKFHDGKILAASDVKGSIEAVEPTDYGSYFTTTIKSITVIDPLTLKIDTNGPDPLLTSRLANLFVYDTTSTKKNDAINGTGPYTLASDTKDDIKLAAFDAYHGGHVYTRQLDYVGYKAPTDLPGALLKNRQLGVIVLNNGNADSPSTLSEITRDGYTLQTAPTYLVAHLEMNTLRKGSPFAMVAVRKAVAQAINTAKIIQLLKANGTNVTTASQTIANGIPGYNPAITAPSYSLAAAKAALTSAGYPDGFSFKLTFFDNPKNQILVNELQKELAQVGITAKLDPETDQNKLGSLAYGGNTDMFFVVGSSSIFDGSDMLTDFIDSANYSNKALDDLNTKANQELNPTTRLATLHQMAQLVAHDQADIVLYQNATTNIAHDPSVVLHADNANGEVGVYYWQTYATK